MPCFCAAHTHTHPHTHGHLHRCAVVTLALAVASVSPSHRHTTGRATTRGNGREEKPIVEGCRSFCGCLDRGPSSVLARVVERVMSCSLPLPGPRLAAQRPYPQPYDTPKAVDGPVEMKEECARVRFPFTTKVTRGQARPQPHDPSGHGHGHSVSACVCVFVCWRPPTSVVETNEEQLALCCLVCCVCHPQPF